MGTGEEISGLTWVIVDTTTEPVDTTTEPVDTTTKESGRTRESVDTTKETGGEAEKSGTPTTSAADTSAAVTDAGAGFINTNKAGPVEVPPLHYVLPIIVSLIVILFFVVMGLIFRARQKRKQRQLLNESEC